MTSRDAGRISQTRHSCPRSPRCYPSPGPIRSRFPLDSLKLIHAWSDSGKSLSEFDRSVPEVDRRWGDVGQSSPELGQDWSGSGRDRGGLDESGPGVGRQGSARIGVSSTNLRANSTKLGPMSADDSLMSLNVGYVRQVQQAMQWHPWRRNDTDIGKMLAITQRAFRCA